MATPRGNGFDEQYRSVEIEIAVCRHWATRISNPGWGLSVARISAIGDTQEIQTKSTTRRAKPTSCRAPELWRRIGALPLPRTQPARLHYESGAPWARTHNPSIAGAGKKSVGVRVRLKGPMISHGGLPESCAVAVSAAVRRPSVTGRPSPAGQRVSVDDP